LNEFGSTGPRLAASLGRLLLALVLLAAVPAPHASAQDIEIRLADETDTGLRDVLLQALLEDTGGQAIELRILRMTLQPGARSPWHAHPGLEFGVVEAGTLRVQVSGEAVLRPADAAPDAESQIVPENLDLSLSPGDRVAYAPGTEMTFENPGPEPAVLLAATVFPTGEGAPPSASFRGGPPSPEQNEGIQSVILGQAIVDAAPPGSVVVFERLEVDAGDNVAAFPGPVLMAMEEGTVAGSVRSSGAGTPGDSTSGRARMTSSST
jgi:quercetin dioxygenase-like cupin family protein